jgi:eukaryotic-like serine/threonine-protein kinase
MSPERWRRVEALFDAALALPAQAREAFLEELLRSDPELGQEVRSLLGHADNSSRLEAVLGSVADDLVGASEGGAVGRRVGPYALLTRLGEGGMGSVWLAERVDHEFEHRVAIKLVRGGPGAESLAERFRAERQILARLVHPNIARLLDGGTTDDGAPYLVMEHVEGRPLTLHCRGHGLTLAQRVELFRTVCLAVEHAHRNLVLHQDLKPSNILVDSSGVPKLLDFGIASLLGAAPGPGADARASPPALRRLTPDYASPEQERGESLTTASDVYSLGVLLHELVLDERPSGREPLGPSLDPDLRGILARALAAEPTDRYGSAEQLALDLRRFLEGRPVEARPATFGYRATKFVGRHRWPVAASLLTFAALLALTVGLALQNARTAREMLRAQRAETQAERVASFLQELFRVADPSESRGSTVTARELLDRGAAQLEAELGSEPEVRARLLRTVGGVYRALGLRERSLELLQRALRLQQETSGSALEAAGLENEIGDGLRELSRFQEAEPYLRRSLATRSARLPTDHLNLADSLNNLGLLLQAVGRPSEAEPLLERALEVRRHQLGEQHALVALSLSNLALLRREQDRPQEAEAGLLAALAIRRQVLPPGHPQLASSLHTLASLLAGGGRLAEAEAFNREAHELRRRTLGVEHPMTLLTLNNLASVLQDQGKLIEAERAYREILQHQRVAQPRDHLDVAVALNNLASLLLDLGRLAQAEPLFAASLAMRQRLFPPGHPAVARAQINLGRAHCLAGRCEAGLALIEAGQRWRREHLGHDHSEVAAGQVELGRALHVLGRFGQAETALQAGLALQERQLAATHPTLLETRLALAELESVQGEASRCRQTLALARARLGLEPPLALPLRGRLELALGNCADAAGASARARSHWQAARDVLLGSFGPGNRWVVEAQRHLDTPDGDPSS